MNAGDQFGAYRVVAKLGEGGMGEVYRARDTRLDRDVALKVLPEALAGDPERIGRFEREAKALAALNHPSIATLYGLEHSSNRHLLVMELVEGDTLQERIVRAGALPLDEALHIGIQIAEALESAHERGIVHRDLKPANVKVFGDPPTVKVLDFGLAKALETHRDQAAAISNSPTLSVMATGAGVILGTAAYMSPEQAKGLAADHRTDIFAFGCVLFEMLTGRLAFEGDSVPEILATVIKNDPDWTTLPGNLPARLVELLRRCLTKSRRERYQSIGDVRIDLERIRKAPQTDAAVAQTAPPASGPWWRRAFPVAAGLLLGVVATAAGAWIARPAPAAAPVVRFSTPLGDQTTFAFLRRQVGISADGSMLAVTADWRIYVRSLTDLQLRAIPGTESHNFNISNPTFSPDGQSLAYWSRREGGIQRIPLAGGAAARIASFDTNPHTIAWNDRGIVYVTNNEVVRVSPQGGTPEVLLAAGADETFGGGDVLPMRDTLLISIRQRTDSATVTDQSDIVAYSPATKERTMILKGGGDPRYLDGFLLFFTEGVLSAVRFDPERLAVIGTPTPVIQGVRRNPSTSGSLALSANGAIAYIPGPPTAGLLAWQPATYETRGTSGKALNIQPASYGHPRLSPDGRMAAFDRADDGAVWVYAMSGESAIRRLTLEGLNTAPTWSADSARVTYYSERENARGIFWQRADGTDAAVQLTRAETGVRHIPKSWSRDGQFLLFDEMRGDAARLWVYSSRDRKSAPVPGVESTLQTDAIFSPDARWFAYSMRGVNDGRSKVFVQPYPPTGARYQLSRDEEDGHHPAWSPDGGTLYYTPGPGNRLLAVRVRPSPTLTFSEPALMTRTFRNDAPNVFRPWDVLPDGSGFLSMSRPSTLNGNLPNEVIVVLNWRRELDQLVRSTP